MVFENKQIFPYQVKVVFGILLPLVLYSCASEQKQIGRPAPGSIRFDSKSGLLHWYDVTYKSYYGLKGPVEIVFVKPVTLADKPEQIASDGWKLRFNKNGRLVHRKRISGDADFETTYAYNEKNQLKYVASSLDGKLWRTTNYIYQEGKLTRSDFIDRKNKDKFSVRNERRETRQGYFEIQYPVEKTGLPVYTEYLENGRMIWSSRGDINNGLGELYYLRTVDGVTSASVANKDTAQMTGVGGYRYHYDNKGLLKTVESYNGHKNRLFHTTYYQYDDLWLLTSEHRKVTDTSPFNQAINEGVDYQYRNIDRFGNWLEREVIVASKFQTQRYSEKRTITYFK